MKNSNDPNRLRFGNPGSYLKKYVRPEGAKVWRVQFSGVWIKGIKYKNGNRFYLTDYIKELPFQKVVDYKKTYKEELQKREKSQWNDRAIEIIDNFPTTPLKLYEEFEYGDVIWGGYAQCYQGECLYFIGGNYWDKKSWYVNKARSLIRMGDMYYAIPMEFSDAPLDYYKQEGDGHCEIIEEIVDLSKMHIFSKDKKEFFEKKIKEVRKNKGVHKSDAEYNQEQIDLSKFPNEYYGCFEIQGTWKEVGFVPKKVMANMFEEHGDLEEGHEQNLFQQCYKERLSFQKTWETNSKVILAGTLNNILPWEVCLHVLSFEDFFVY